MRPNTTQDLPLPREVLSCPLRQPGRLVVVPTSPVALRPQISLGLPLRKRILPAIQFCSIDELTISECWLSRSSREGDEIVARIFASDRITSARPTPNPRQPAASLPGNWSKPVAIWACDLLRGGRRARPR